MSLLRPCANMQSSEMPYAMRLAVVKEPRALEDGGMQGVGNEKPTYTFSRLFFCLTFMSGLYLLLSPPSSLESQLLPGDWPLVFADSLLMRYTLFQSEYDFNLICTLTSA